MSETKKDSIRQLVRENYGKIARQEGQSCGCVSTSCCGAQPTEEEMSRRMGYSTEDLSVIPEGANLGLGCGNPQILAQLHPGETVVDLGSGAGFDCFLAARAVGETGKVIGVDMTPDMLSKARENATNGGFANVDFRLGEIEHLPIGDNTVDVIISNCVINLSPDKQAVFNDAFRTLKPGGRLAISDVVAVAEIPAQVLNSPQYYCSCAAGAAPVNELERMLAAAGFETIHIHLKEESKELIREWFPGTGVEEIFRSANIQARKPLDR
ncbi:MAG TPA: arsenite methyltransferase [bacterium]|nr:arsenite methyltransferase [bacterium]